MKKKLFIIIFLILICLPYPVSYLASSFLDDKNYEKREKTPFPNVSETGLSGFTGNLELYINDRLPFRNELVSGYSLLNLALLRSSANRKVVLGKDGWLYYNAPDRTENSIIQYRGTELLTEAQLHQIAENAVRIKEKLEAEGKRFILFIAPNKERIYSEHMPEYYGLPAKEYPAGQIVSYLKEYTDVPVVYPYEEIMMSKPAREEEYSLYYKTDTHWNQIGAYIGTRELLKEMGIVIPEVNSPSIRIEAEKGIPGDLSDMLHIGTYLDPGLTYKVSGYSKEKLKSSDPLDFCYTSKDGDPRSLFVIRDSYCIDMAPILGSQFKESSMIHYERFDPSDPRFQNADIVVMETLEREAAGRLLNPAPLFR